MQGNASILPEAGYPGLSRPHSAGGRPEQVESIANLNLRSSYDLAIGATMKLQSEIATGS